MSDPKKSLRHRQLKASLREASVDILALELKKAIFDDARWKIDAILDACQKNEAGPAAVRNALEDAASLGRLQIVEQMLTSGGPDFYKDKPQISFAFQKAVIHGHYRVAGVLKDHGAKAYEVADGPRLSPSAMSALIADGNMNGISFLVSQLKKDDNFPQTLSPALEHAIAAKNLKIVQFLIGEGADINGGKRSETPLDAAVRSQHMRIIKFLLSKGARPESSQGSEALFTAVERRNPDIVNLLIKHGADVKDQSKSLFSMALYNNDYDMAALLVKHGADVNAEKGNLVAEALLARNERAVEFFFRNGADSKLAEEAFGRIAADPFLRYRMPGADIAKSQELLKTWQEQLQKDASQQAHGPIQPLPQVVPPVPPTPGV